MPAPDKPTLFHPLAGADPPTYLKHWFGNLPYPLRSTHIRAIATFAVAIRYPKVIVERLKLRRAIASQQLDAGPIFVIGHWRSGTTLLHNLLSQDPRFGWMTFVQAGMPLDCTGKFKAARWFIRMAMPKTRRMDDVAIGLDTPQEEEIALANMNPLSFFNAFYFPRNLMKHYREAVLFDGASEPQIDKFAASYRYLVKKFSSINDGKLMLFKNPANTGRIAFLKDLFPNAKFIHIVRNPYEVYASMQKLWPTLFRAFSMHPYQEIDTHPSTLEIYQSLMKKFLAEQPSLPDDDFIELRFEDIERNPIAELTKVYQKFSLPDRDASLEKIRSYSDSLKGYRRSRYQLPQATLDEVGERWKFALDHWSYSLPESIESI